MGFISNSLPSLDTLSIGWTPITGPAVAKYPGLTHLRILKVPGMEKARAIAPALRGNQTMEELVLNGCKFEDTDMELINTLSHLKRLQLRDEQFLTPDRTQPMKWAVNS